MSNLIVMPGSKEFQETLNQTSAKPRSRTPKSLQPCDLAGKMVMLNTALISRFQCGGLSLGPKRPMAMITSETQQDPVRVALSEGKLLDVTGQDMTKGFKGKGGETSPVTEEDTGKRCFIATDSRGNLYVATPKSKAESKRFEREIATTGTLQSVDFEPHFSGISDITEEVIESSTVPVKRSTKKSVKKKKATTNVRSSGNSGSSRRK